MALLPATANSAASLSRIKVRQCLTVGLALRRCRPAKAGPIRTNALPHPIAADGEMGVALAAAFGEVAGHDLFAVHPYDRAAHHVGDHVVGDERGTGTGGDQDGDANV